MRHKKLILFYSVLLILVLCVMRTLYQNRQTALSPRDYPEIPAYEEYDELLAAIREVIA